MRLVCLFALSVSPGCGRSAPAPVAKGKDAGPARTKVTDYPLEGVVREVRRESGQVVIRHEEIAGFMKAMTMPFSVRDRALFDDLRVGDEVEGTLRVESEGDAVKDYQLVDLAVRKPAMPDAAPAPSLTLSFKGGVPELRPTPKRLEPGQVVPDFAMTTEDGKALRLSDLRGKVVALTFIYTRCPLPDFCPLMDRKFAELASAVGAVPARAANVRLISLSFDPEHDTPEVLKKHARTQGATPPLWTFAVASHDELAKVAPLLGLVYGPTADEIVHNLSTAIIGPDGRLDALFVGAEAKSSKTADLLRVINSALVEAKPTP
jgi:protein SCO1/2